MHLPFMRCAYCGAELPSEARFCVLCGAPVEAEPAGPGPAASPPGQIARIQLWRGYLRSEFVVELDDPDLDETVEIRSRPFRWRRDAPPPEDRRDVREVYDDLVACLEGLGWEQVGQASPWYSQRFRRRNGPLDLAESGRDEERLSGAPRQAS